MKSNMQKFKLVCGLTIREIDNKLINYKTRKQDVNFK